MWLVGSSYGKAYFLRSAKQTTGIASINKGQLSDFPVIIPSMEIQVRFSKAMSALDRMIAVARNASGEVDSLFSALQHRAFSGQL
jgi:type I restriction enzyme S subunit